MSVAVDGVVPDRVGDAGLATATERAEVVRALRLGWYLAEVRGRVWWRGQRPATEGLPPDPDRPLPLRPQRTAAESRQQAVGTLIELAERLQVAGPGGDSPADGGTAFAPRLLLLVPAAGTGAEASASPEAGEPPGGSPAVGSDEQAWPQLAALLYEWDAAVQDQLTARSDMLACGYLLGRGLAECFWALAPADDQVCPDGVTPAGGSWQFLFGTARRHELSRLVGRVGRYLNPLTPVAVSGSLEAWGCVAADPAWCAEPAAPAALYEQSRRWYQLLVLGQDPSTLVRPTALLRARSTTLRLGRAFLPQLLIGALSLGAVAAFLLLLTAGRGGAFTQTLLALIGTLGVGASALTARAKNLTQSLLTRLRQNAYSDLVALEVTCVPTHPRDAREHATGPSSHTHRAVERAVTARTVAEPLHPVR
jgi:hypothetical protein